MTHPLTNALAMRTAAVSARWEDHVADNSPKYLTDWQRGLVAGQQAMRAAILALPLEADHAALLAEAVKVLQEAAQRDWDSAPYNSAMPFAKLNKKVQQMLINDQLRSALETP